MSYTAEAHFGGLDRVFIHRYDPMADLCARLSLVSPADIDQFDVTTPMGWSVESVTLVEGADCPPEQPSAWATAGSGTVEFDSLDAFDYFPCELSVDASFDLDTDPPSAISFTITDLSVLGPDC